jgi:hypothetical protein
MNKRCVLHHDVQNVQEAIINWYILQGSGSLLVGICNKEGDGKEEKWT